MGRPLSGQRYAVLMLDGIELGVHVAVIALGVDAEGRKQVPGLREGAAGNAAVCKALLADLVDRGLDASEGILVVIDGSKALEAGREADMGRCAFRRNRPLIPGQSDHP